MRKPCHKCSGPITDNKGAFGLCHKCYIEEHREKETVEKERRVLN